MKMIEDKLSIFSHYSTKALLAVGTMQGVWALTPAEWIKTYPDWVTPTVAGVSAILAGLGVFGKLIDQTPAEVKETP
jgi:hypothetical protein